MTVSVMLSDKKRRAAHALARGHTVAGAADIAGCSERSIYRWVKDREFTQAVTAAETEELERASRRLVSLMERALDVLEEMLEHKSPRERRIAANSVITHALKLRELVTLESRVAELERVIG